MTDIELFALAVYGILFAFYSGFSIGQLFGSRSDRYLLEEIELESELKKRGLLPGGKI